MTKLNWGFSTLGTPDFSLEEIGALARKHSIGFVEIRMIEKRTDLPALFAEQYQTAAAITSVLDRYALKIVGLNSGFKLVDYNDQSRAELKDFCTWASNLKVPYVRVFGGIKYGSELSARHVQAANEALDWWFTEKSRHNWRTELLLETHDVFSNSDEVLKFIGKLKHPLSIIWDSHHTARYAGEEFADSWRKLKPLVKHIHVKDSINKPSAKHHYTYTMPGAGELSIPALLDMLRDDNFQGVVSLEWELAWHPYLPSMDAALAQAAAVGWIDKK